MFKVEAKITKNKPKYRDTRQADKRQVKARLDKTVLRTHRADEKVRIATASMLKQEMSLPFVRV
jgi:hypothetical protein